MKISNQKIHMKMMMMMKTVRIIGAMSTQTKKAVMKILEVGSNPDGEGLIGVKTDGKM